MPMIDPAVEDYAERATTAAPPILASLVARARTELPRPSMVSGSVVGRLLGPAEAAGSLFTVNPLNVRHDEVLSNAAWGLGEAVDVGEVTPDTIAVSKSTGKVIRRETAEKKIMNVWD